MKCDYCAQDAKWLLAGIIQLCNDHKRAAENMHFDRVTKDGKAPN